MENKRKKERKEGSCPEEEGSGMAGNGSRWQPTKEQIDILEGVYSAGVKTPSAEQIQQITARLSAYGHIEGKNVFYWFQNTKARRRQRQKQDRFAYLTRFYHASPIFPPPPPPPPPIIPAHVVSEAGFYYYHPYEQVEPMRWGPRNAECKTTTTTLELFPLLPGGVGGESNNNSGSTSNSWSDQTTNDDEYSHACKDVQGGGFIDFFSANSATQTTTASTD